MRWKALIAPPRGCWASWTNRLTRHSRVRRLICGCLRWPLAGACWLKTRSPASASTTQRRRAAWRSRASLPKTLPSNRAGWKRPSPKARIRLPTPRCAARLEDHTMTEQVIGTTMMLHCDYAVAATDARFSTPFVALGLVPEAASSLLAPRLMGHRRAFELLVMGKPLSGEEAKACGLINQVVPADQVEAEAMKAAQAIAALPLEGVAISRRLMKGAPDEIVKRMDEESSAFRQRIASPEAREAFTAFLNRKK